MLLSTTAILLVVIVTIEAIIIVMGNAFTIFVFWTQRLRLKRTFLLLINLAVADLFAGLGEALVLATNTIPNGGSEIFQLESPWLAFQAFGSSMSVLFLALISLERVYSVLRPFRHRVTSTRAYIYSIVIAWVIALAMGGVWLVKIYLNDKPYVSLTYSSSLFISLSVICASYLTIRSRLQSITPDHDLDVRRKASRERTLRMSRTFFIVVGVSLVFCLPAFVMFTVKEFCSCFSPLAVAFVTVLLCANSLVNPFVYSFRMPIFQDALKKCWRKRQQTMELRAISKKPHNTERNLWVMAWWPTGYCLRVRSFWAPAIVGDVFLGRWKFGTANLMVGSIRRLHTSTYRVRSLSIGLYQEIKFLGFNTYLILFCSNLFLTLWGS